MYVFRVFSKWKRITFTHILRLLLIFKNFIENFIEKTLNSKAIEKVISLRSGVKLIYEEK